jgi:hypothetical protein
MDGLKGVLFRSGNKIDVVLNNKLIKTARINLQLIFIS